MKTTKETRFADRIKISKEGYNRNIFSNYRAYELLEDIDELSSRLSRAEALLERARPYLRQALVDAPSGREGDEYFGGADKLLGDIETLKAARELGEK